MYFSHFGLVEAPFGMTPNPNFFYAGCSRGDILQALLYAVAHGEGIIKVTGEVGSGKTMLCRMLESSLPPQVEVIYLVNPTLSREQVVYALAGELHLDTRGKRVDEVIRMLHQDLIAKHIQGKQVVLLIEEAQAMSLDTLEEIRLFSNLETARHKLLQIVLFGQPELNMHLALPQMRQLKERITHSFHVPPLEKKQIAEFLLFRLRAAGYRGPNVFSRSAIAQIERVSKGIVRRITILADKAMLAAFADNTHSIGRKQIVAAIRDSEFAEHQPALRPRFGGNSNHLLLTASIVLSSALTLAGVMAWQNYRDQAKPGVAADAPVPSVKAALMQPPSAPASVPGSAPAGDPAGNPAVAPAVAPAIAPAIAPVVAPAIASATASAPATTEQTAPKSGLTAATTLSAPQQTAVTSTAGPATGNPPGAVADVKTPAQAASAPAKEAVPAPATPVASAASAAAAPSAPMTASAPPANLAQKLAASRVWMEQAQAAQHTLQLNLVTRKNLAGLGQFLQKMQKKLPQESIHLYPSRVGGVERYGVLLGDFNDRNQARQMQVKLEKEFGHASQIRSIGGLRAEILKTDSADMWQM